MIRIGLAYLIGILATTALAGEPQQKRFRFIGSLERGEGITIVVYGTSLTEKGAWPRLLHEVLAARYRGPIQLINAAESGRTSHWGLEELERRVIQKRPDVMFMEFAINDAHRRFGLSPDDTRNNLIRMIDRVERQLPHCEIILMTMSDAKGQAEINRQFRLPEYYEAVRMAGRVRHRAVLDLFPVWQRLRSENENLFDEYMPDGLHPNELATRKLILPTILSELSDNDESR